MKLLKIAVLLVVGMLPWAGLDAQQTATARFGVTAKVEEFCDVTARDPALGNRTALLRATCTPDTTYNVGLNKVTSTGVGTGRAVDHTVFGGVPAARAVPSGGDTITVHIYY